MIWRKLGFKKDIFFVEPLVPTEEDMALFVGREDEAKQYLIDTLSSTRALKIVSGDIGVGKTTFVNACQYFSYSGKLPFEFDYDVPKVLPCFEKLQLMNKMTLEEFSTQVIISVCKSIVYHCDAIKKEPPQQIQEILNFFLNLYYDNDGKGFSGGISVLGSGYQFGKNQATRGINILRNSKIVLKNLVEITRKELDFEGVFVTVNNLEILRQDDILRFFNEGRDELFDIQGIYWTFIGYKGVGNIIEQRAKRVADYFSGTELNIAPLSFKTTKKIIDTRVEALRNRDDANCPLDDDTIQRIYSLSMNETRETLKICNEIVKRVMKIQPSIQVIPPQIAMSAFMEYAHDYARNIVLTQKNIQLLAEMYIRKICRSNDHKEFGYQTASGFVSALNSLVDKRLLSVKSEENTVGMSKYYQITGLAVITALTGALGKQIEQTARFLSLVNGNEG